MIGDVNKGRLLLVGDDGRMADLLEGRLGEYQVTAESSVTEGIVQLGRGHYAAVLVNAERLAGKSADVVRAIRRIGGTVRVLLYGDAYTEGYARQGVSQGADDYLIWPIPEKELRESLSGADNPSRINEFIHAAPPEAKVIEERPVQTQRHDLLEHYGELSLEAGRDKEALIRRAQEIVARQLGVRWVKITELESGETLNKEQTKASRLGESEWVQELKAGNSAIGWMAVGPLEAEGAEIDVPIMQEAAALVGSLVHLAQRCDGLVRLATTDDLTGAYNRRYLEYYLQQVLGKNISGRGDMALLLFDIDNFKHYNDTYGHVAGDEILKQVTQLMRRCSREQDVVARIGGDEFGVLFWDPGPGRERFSQAGDAEETGDSKGDGSVRFPSASHPETAFFLCNRFRRILRRSEFPALGAEARGAERNSGGLASFPTDGQTPEELWAKADIALLNAKRSGKNRIVLVGQPEAG